MRGRIKVWNAGSAQGRIQADNGDSISFEFSAVLAYDVPFLAVGRLVSFDLEGPNGSTAANICLHRLQPSPEGTPRRPDILRYVGFDQAEGIRSYKFECTPPEEEMKTVVVTTDIALFIRHRVPLQEGPGLCLRLLETESAKSRESRFALTENDLITFLAARLGASIKPHARHVWRRPRPAVSGWPHAPAHETGK
jgi:cold shock CspA family protein